jgi:hypothetical protein
MSRPETLAQAVEWQRVKTRYLLAGLCHYCAGQAAYGHQFGSGGFNAVRPPCADCAPLVEMFAYATRNPLWRAAIRKRL